MKWLQSSIIMTIGALVIVAATVEAKSLTPKPQPGTNSIQTFVGDHHALTTERKMSSVLMDHPKRLERRTRDYAKQFGVSVEALEFLPPKPAKKKEFLRPVPVRTVVKGSLPSVTAHLKRMSLFAMAQTPVSLEINMLPDKPDQFELKSLIDYYQIADPEAFYHYGKPNVSPTKVNAVEIEQYEDQKVEQLRKETDALAKRQENHLLPSLVEPVVEQCQKDKTKVCFEKLTWSRAKGINIVAKKDHLAHGS